MDSSPVTLAIFKKAAAVTTFAMTASLSCLEDGRRQVLPKA